MTTLPSFFSAVSAPVYSNPGNTSIDCVVTISEDAPCKIAGQTVPFTAAPNDSQQYGIDLYNYLVAGGAGAIGAYVAPTLTAQQKATAAINSGVTITSTGTPAINGTYPLDANTQRKLNGVVTYIMVHGAFPPASASSLNWYDISGIAHTFPNTTVFSNFATALADFIAQVDEYSDSNGAGSLPSNDVAIP